MKTLLLHKPTATMKFFGRAAVRREALAREGISAEVVDPRTLQPLEKGGLLASVQRTGRAVVTDESHNNCGVTAGLAAIIVDEAFASLRMPTKRVSMPPVPVPFALALEDFMNPTAE